VAKEKHPAQTLTAQRAESLAHEERKLAKELDET
jgi:hypothetical protein